MRVEAYRATMTAEFLKVYLNYHNIEELPIEHHIDNKGVIKRTNNNEWRRKLPSKTTAPEQEIIEEFHASTKKYKTYQIHHVKSHQKGNNLKRPAVLNN